MATQARRLGGPVFAAAGVAGSFGPVPVGKRWLIRLVRVVNQSSTVTGAIRWAVSTSASANVIGRFDGVLPLSMRSDDSWWCLNAGESFWYLTSSGTVPTLILSVHGYELSV